MSEQTQSAPESASGGYSEAELKRFLDLLDAVRRADAPDKPPDRQLPDEAERTRLDAVLGYSALSSLSGRGGSVNSVIAGATRDQNGIKVDSTHTLNPGASVQVIWSSGASDVLALDQSQTCDLSGQAGQHDAHRIEAIRIFDHDGRYVAWVGPIPALAPSANPSQPTR